MHTFAYVCFEQSTVSLADANELIVVLVVKVIKAGREIVVLRELTVPRAVKVIRVKQGPRSVAYSALYYS